MNAYHGRVRPLKNRPFAYKTFFLSALLFLIPSFMLLQTAAMPSARATHAIRHALFQMDNEEGALLFQAMQIRKGHSIYHTLDKPPYFAGTYTPLFMATVAAFDDFQHPSFKVGRTIVFVSALGVALCLLLIVVGTTHNAGAGLLAAILFLTTYETYRWIPYFRVDFPALFLTLAGLATVTLAHRRRGSLCLGALLMILALYTKQTMLAAPLACIASLAISCPRKAAQFIGWLLLWGLPPLVALNIMTDSEFTRHIIFYNMNTFSADDLKIWLNHVGNIHRWFSIAAVISLIWLIRCYRNARTETEETDDPDSRLAVFWQPLIWYGVLAQWNIIGAAKAGSAENYLLEPIATWCLLITLAGGSVIKAIASTNGRPPKIAVIALVSLITPVFLHTWFINSSFARERLFTPYINPSRSDFQASQRVLTLTKAANQPLTELAIFPLQDGKQPVLQPFIMSELSRQGRWDQQPFVKSIADAKYDLVVAQHDLTTLQPPIEFTKEMLAAFRASYKLEETIRSPLWTYHLLVPKDSTDTPSITNIANVQ